MSNRINFAIVGAGYIGKRHAEMIINNPDAHLLAFADILDSTMLGLDKFDAPHFFSMEEMLEKVDADVICIASPNGLHTKHALLALEAGKHIVIEKPIALTKKDGDAISLKASQMQRQVFCVMQNRFSPPAVWLKGLMDDNVLGKIFMVQINCYWNRDDRYYKKAGWKGTKELDGGTLFTQFSHFVDIMYWLFGDVKQIKATFNNYTHQHSTEFEDSGIVQFEFVNGGMGCINYSTTVWDKNLESSITIIAENGTVKVGGQYMDKVEYCHIKDYTMPVLPASNPANDYGIYKGSAANHHYIFENVIDVLNNNGTIKTNIQEATKVVDIIERIYQLKKKD
jgi:predicted dehydrogenase